MKTITAKYELPMAVRPSDVKQLSDCPLSWAMRYTHPEQLADAVFFALGGFVHQTIAEAIQTDLGVEAAVDQVIALVDDWRLQVDRDQLIETAARTVDSMAEDAARLCRSWFKWCHPSSLDRLDIFKSYNWPPKVEATYVRTDLGTSYPVWGTVDAVFAAPDGSTMIVDWKTGTRKSDSLQLNLYRLLLGEPEARAVFVHLDRVQERAVVQASDPYPGDEAMIHTVKSAESIKARIISERRARAVPGRQCGTCIARAVCPVQTRSDEAMGILARRIQRLRPAVPLNITSALAS